MTPDRAAGVEVLLVEDDPDDARFVERSILEDQLGTELVHLIEVVQIDRVDRLSDGLERVRRESPDVVLLDLTLPDSSGLETLERMVEHAPRVPVIVLTGRDDVGIGVEAIQRGAQDYLRKADIGASLLRRTLRYAIERKRNQRDLRDRSNRLALLNRIVHQDLRNDVSMIVGRADELRGSVQGPDEPVLDELLDAARHAIDLVDTTGEVMDVLSADGIEPTPCDLDAMIDAAVARAQADRDATVTVKRAAPEDSVTIYGSSMLQAAFRHLIVTAVDYADDPTPEVTVAVETTEDRATVTVAQSGQWLTESRAQFLEDPDSSHVESRIGIGLYLVRTVLDSVGGTISVDEIRHESTAVRIDFRRGASA